MKLQPAADKLSLVKGLNTACLALPKGKKNLLINSSKALT